MPFSREGIRPPAAIAGRREGRRVKWETGFHIATLHSRTVSIATFVSSLLVVWFGLALTH